MLRGYQKGILSMEVRRVVIKSVFWAVVLQRARRGISERILDTEHNAYVYLLLGNVEDSLPLFLQTRFSRYLPLIASLK